MQKTEKLVLRRRFREVITVKQDERITLVCETCQSEQSFKLVKNSDNTKLTDGEKFSELQKN